MIASCPRCEGSVRVPHDVSPEAPVRCPLCGAEYALAEVLASLPPVLEVVETVEPSGATAAGGAGIELPARQSPGEEADAGGWGVAAAVFPAETPVQGDSALAGPNGTEGGAACASVEPLAAGSIATETAADKAATGRRDAVEAASGQSDREPAEQGPQLDIWQRVAETPRIDFGQTAAPPAEEAIDHAVFAGFAAEDEQAEAAPSKPGMPRRPGKKRKEKNVAKELVGAIVGGFLGLSIGYYLLNLIGGSRFDFLQIPLPFVAHTAKHWGSEPPPVPDSGKPAAPKPKQQKSSPSRPQSSSGAPVGAAADIAEEPLDAGDAAAPEPLEGVGGLGGLMASLQPDPALTGESPGHREPASPATAEPIGVKNAPNYPPAELAAALRAAHEAIGCAACNSTGFVLVDGKRVVCDACKGQPNLSVTGESFQLIRELAEKLTFVDASDPAPVTDRRLAAEALIERVAEYPAQDEQLGRMAANLLQSNDKPHGGIILVGTARPPVSKDGLHGMTVELSGIPMTVSVLSDKPLTNRAGQHVAVLGSLVWNPAETVAGYVGRKEFVVWSGSVIPITPGGAAAP